MWRLKICTNTPYYSSFLFQQVIEYLSWRLVGARFILDGCFSWSMTINNIYVYKYHILKTKECGCIWRWPVAFDHRAKLCAYIMIKISVWYILKVSQYQRFTCGHMFATQHSCDFTCATGNPWGDIIGDQLATRNKSLEICNGQVLKSKQEANHFEIHFKYFCMVDQIITICCSQILMLMIMARILCCW